MDNSPMDDVDLSDDSDDEEDFEVAIDPDCQCEPCRWNYAKSLEYEESDKAEFVAGSK